MRCARLVILPLLMLGLIGVALVGCGPQKANAPATATHTTVYFPAAPDAPRLQYLMTLTGAESIVKKDRGSFADWVVGEDASGKPSGQFINPYGMDADNGKLYICDVARDRVHVVDMNTRTYSLLGTPQQIGNPVNIKIDDQTGLRYVCDTGKRVVHVFDRSDTLVRTIRNEQAWSPIDLAIGNGKLYICDVTGCKVWVYSMDGKMESSISHKGEGPDELSMPTNLEIGPDGRIYVVDTFQQIVKIFDDEGQFVGSVGRPSSDIGGFARPKGIAIDEQGVIYVADAQWDAVQLFNSKAELLLVFGTAGQEPYAMGLPAGITIDKSSLSAFSKYISPDFDAEYLLFVVNQFGRNKVVVYAYGNKR